MKMLICKFGLSKNVLNMRDKIETQNIVEPLPLIIEADVKDG
jgi:hypothetical protein